MSITFTVAFDPADITGYAVTSYDWDTGEQDTLGTFATRADAVAAYPALTADRLEGSIDALVAVEYPEVNMSNTNAMYLMGILGLPVDDDAYCGSITADELIERILLASAVDRDESATPDVVTTTPGLATWVECGLPEGYVSSRLAGLWEVATAAKNAGRLVQWC